MTAPGMPRWSLHPQLDADTHPLAHWPLSELLLMDDANYPWLILVPRVPDVRELVDLDIGQQTLLLGDINRVSRALQQVFRPHKLNVAALGNQVPQLHVHVIARFTDDPAWPTPVWGRVEARRYEPEALVTRVRALRDALSA
jgi:diadenosine tetraphosphate (Ap4A) HIT family hydrolase